MKSKGVLKAALLLNTAALAISALGGCARQSSKESAAPGSETAMQANTQSRTSAEQEEARRKAESAVNNPYGEQQTDLQFSVTPAIPLEDGQTGENQNQGDEEPVAQGGEIIDGIYYQDGILIANKKHGLPADYAPGVDPTANAQVNALIADMIAQGMDVIYETSNFRSYDTQAGLYNSYVASYGQAEADTFSARPGYSEHQTGLAFDLKHSSGALLTGEVEAQWLLDNAWKYGFIVRYQEGKEAVTGYQAEPWHLRYIGDRAQEIAQSGLCLEEFLGIEGGDYIQ